MNRKICALAAAAAFLVAFMAPEPASAQKHGGILKMYMADSPAGLSCAAGCRLLAGLPCLSCRAICGSVRSAPARSSSSILAFTAGKFDMTFPYSVTIPLLRDVNSQAPQAICELAPGTV